MLLGRGSTLLFRLGLVLSGAVFASIGSVISADGREKEGQSDPIPLTIKEIHKVKRADDPSGRQQNIKVVLDPHDPVLDAETYILSLETLDNGTVQYEAVHIPDPTATEVEFEGNFLDATEVVIQAAKGGTPLAYGAVDAEVKDPGSRVAWVGDPASPSLRVDPGRRGQVEVPGQAPCEGSSDSNPCYYFGYSHQPLEPPLPRCDGFGPVLFCDDIVTELENPEYPVTLELYNREILRVFIKPPSFRTEVVVSSPENSTILSPDDYACLESFWGTCTQFVDVPDSMDSLYIITVALDEDGYASLSSASPFEVYKASVARLTSDVYQVSLDPSNSPGNYSVSMNREARVYCDGTQGHSDCRAFFDKVIYDYNVTIAKGWEMKMVIYPVGHQDPPPRSTVHSITSLSESSKMKVQITSQQAVSKAEVISFKNYVATTIQEVKVHSVDSGYTMDVPSCTGKCELVFLGYGSDETLMEAGEAYVFLEDLDINVAEVGQEPGNLSSLRVDVWKEDEVLIDGVGKCRKFGSPCYFFQRPREVVQSAIHCVNISSLPIYGLNRTSLLQCNDSLTPFSPLPGDFALSMELDSKVIVEGSFPTNTTEVTVFDPDEPNEELSNGQTKCSQTSETTGRCTCYIYRHSDRSPLSVLVTSLDISGAVLSSVMTTYNYPEKKSSSTWIIVGSVIGCVVILAVIASVFCRKKK